MGDWFTVKDLIDALAKLPPDSPIWVHWDMNARMAKNIEDIPLYINQRELSFDRTKTGLMGYPLSDYIRRIA